MKLDRCVLAMLAVMGLAAAGAGCKSQQSDAGENPDQGPPAAQTPSASDAPQSDSDTPPKPSQDDGMRRARRHHGRRGHGRRGWDNNRPNPNNAPPWDNRGHGPQPQPPAPDTPDDN